MTEIIIPSLYCLSGVCAYACFVHLSIGFRRHIDLTQTLFGLMCLVLSIYALFNAQTLKAKDVSEFSIALKLSLDYIILFYIIFLWFIAFFSKTYLLRFLVGISIAYGLLLLANMMHPYSFEYSFIRNLKDVTLPWGETITLAEGQVHEWLRFAIAIILLSYCYIFYALNSFYRQSRNRYVLGMMASVAFLMICSIEGVLVRLSVITFVPLTVYGFLGMIIVMSLILHYDYDQQLRESEEKLRGLYELSPLGIALTDIRGRFIDFNEAFRRICGYTTSELMNLDYWSLTPNEYASQEAEQLDSLLQVGHYGPYEKEYMNKAGDRIPLRLNGILVSGTDGENYIWSIVEDMSDWRRASKALSESEARYQLIVENSIQGIWSVDQSFRTLFVNSAMAKMLGYTAKHMIGFQVEDLVVEEDIPDLRRQMQLRSQGAISHYELRFRRKDGAICWGSITGTPLKDDHGNFIGSFGMVTDITDLKLGRAPG